MDFYRLENVLSFMESRNFKFKPKVDIAETDSHYEFLVYLPGFESSNIRIEMEDNTLTVQGSYPKDKNKNYLLKEFSGDDFIRSFKLQDTSIDLEDINSSFRNGVLKIEIPKKKNKKSIKVISIK